PRAAPADAAPVTVVRDEQTARAVVAGADKAEPTARTEAYRRLGAAARTQSEGIDNGAIVRGGVEGLTAGDQNVVNGRLLGFLVANAGQDNTAMLTALRATPQWEALRQATAAPNAGAGGLPEVWR